MAGSVPQQEAGEPAPYGPRKVGPPGPGPARPRRGRWLDRIIGVLLGLLLGLGVVAVFVFKGSEGTIDAPRISGIGQPGAGGQPQPGLPLGTKVPLIKVIAGKPPPSGPVRLDFKQGRTARFEVQTDIPIGIQIPGYGVDRSLDSGRTLVSFPARKTGQFPIVVASSLIDVATLHVTRR